MTAPSQPAGGPVELARRLKALRKDRSIPQRRVADALGVSIALISAWESETNPTVPAGSRIRDLATFYASERNWSGERGRLLTDAELSAAERGARDEIDEVLRSFTSGPSPVAVVGEVPSTLRFPLNEDIRIVCGRLDQPQDAKGGTGKGHPYTEPDNVNYTDLLTFADVDALMELFGFLRKINPDSDIRFIRADRLMATGSPDDLASHVILLGGLSLDSITGPMLHDAGLPLKQEEEPNVTDQGEIFTLDDGQQFVPELTPAQTLLEDVGLFARAPNPYHSGRSLTVFSGVFSRGVLGAVRTLTDDKLRKSNERYIRDHFAHADRFAILMRVPVRFGKAHTPDLQNARTRLYEWPEDSSGREMAG
jgi:transcriptional regulator with XRE-family HTH domain